jgi:hypothetical protein
VPVFLLGFVLLGSVVGIVVARIDVARAPWLRWSRALYAAGTIPTVLGGAALGGLAIADYDRNWALFLLLILASMPFWLGPRRIVELLLRGGPRRRFLYLAMWARALIYQEPPGLEPPAFWRYDKHTAELDSWSDPQTRPYAELLAARTRDWRTGAAMSPLDALRRNIELARWIGADVIAPVATRRWQLIATYWAAIADSALPERRPVLISSLEAFRDPTTSPFLDLVIGSLAKPLLAWPWDSIEAAGKAIWPDGYALTHADLNAKTLAPALPVPCFVPYWGRGSVPLRPRL